MIDYRPQSNQHEADSLSIVHFSDSENEQTAARTSGTPPTKRPKAFQEALSTKLSSPGPKSGGSVANRNSLGVTFYKIPSCRSVLANAV